jgi:hypothetical protein
MNNQAATRITKEVDELKKILSLILASLLVLGLILYGCAPAEEEEVLLAEK